MAGLAGSAQFSCDGLFRRWVFIHRVQDLLNGGSHVGNVIERYAFGEVGESASHVDADARQPDSCRRIPAPSTQIDSLLVCIGQVANTSHWWL